MQNPDPLVRAAREKRRKCYQGKSGRFSGEGLFAKSPSPDPTPKTPKCLRIGYELTRAWVSRTRTYRERFRRRGKQCFRPGRKLLAGRNDKDAFLAPRPVDLDPLSENSHSVAAQGGEMTRCGAAHFKWVRFQLSLKILEFLPEGSGTGFLLKTLPSAATKMTR